MTQKSIIAIMVLVLMIIVKQSSAGANQHLTGINVDANALTVSNMIPDAVPVPLSKIPFIPAPKPEAPHSKPLKAPHMEELPHIHRFHKDRVKKIRQHHGVCWFLSQLVLVICHLSILFIAYLHVTH